MPPCRTTLAVALSLLPLGQPVLLGSAMALVTGAVLLSPRQNMLKVHCVLLSA